MRRHREALGGVYGFDGKTIVDMATGVYQRSEKEKKRLREMGREAGMRTRFVKGHSAWNTGTHESSMKGKKHSIETRIKMAKSSRKGASSNLWKGGTSEENKHARKTIKYKVWRERVYRRDNWTCQDCGARSENGKRIILHPHHIKPFATFKSLRFVLSNGVTLCRDCHQKRHNHKFTGQKAKRL